MALQNFQKNVAANSHTKNEVNILKKLGFSQEEIDKFQPGQSPFKDYTLGSKNDIKSLLDSQQNFYDDLSANYQNMRMLLTRKEAAEHEGKPMTLEMRDMDPYYKMEDFPEITEPGEYSQWHRRKQLDFERTKNLKLLKFLNHERKILKQDTIVSQKSFLQKYSSGEIDMFIEMTDRII